MACIIQTSDWHLGRPFGNAGARADELRGLQADCVRNRMPAAIRESSGDKVDAILVDRGHRPLSWCHIESASAGRVYALAPRGTGGLGSLGDLTQT
jgi:hypothetical protein